MSPLLGACVMECIHTQGLRPALIYVAPVRGLCDGMYSYTGLTPCADLCRPF